MDFLEKNLEDYIFETPNDLLQKRGLPIKGKKFRQVRIGNYGVADVVTISKTVLKHEKNEFHGEFTEHCLTITIYELKKSNLDLQALGQAARYAKGIQEWFDKTERFQADSIDYKIYLIGSKVTTSGDFVYISDFMTQKCNLYTYSYDFNGISFTNNEGYFLTHPGF